MKNKKIISAILSFVICSGLLPALPVNAVGFNIKGDVNADGVFDLADVVLLQKWLLAVPDTHLENWQAADLCNDNKLDVFDLCLMKRELLYSSQPAQITSPVCKSAAFACIDDETLLYSDNINERIAPASLTKLLTASVALHYLSPDTVITVGSEQSLVKSGSSLCLIKSGHKLKLYDLLTGMLMASGNDAAYTVAVATARAAKPDTAMTDSQAVAYFSELMNNYASSLGMKDSHFTTPEGWDDASQYTTVSDLLILANHAFSIPEIKTITGIYQKKVYFVSGENITWTNTNALLNPNSTYYCADAVGIKTGTTANAGNCLIAAFERNGKTYLSAVVGCNTGNDRYELTLKMLSQFGVDNEVERSDMPTATEPIQTTTTAEITPVTTKTTTVAPIVADKAEIFKRLDTLEYSPITCDGLPEYKLTDDSGAVYWLNLSSKWIWKDGVDAEAVLPDDIISWLIANKDYIDMNTTEYNELQEGSL